MKISTISSMNWNLYKSDVHSELKSSFRFTKKNSGQDSQVSTGILKLKCSKQYRYVNLRGSEKKLNMGNNMS